MDSATQSPRIQSRGLRGPVWNKSCRHVRCRGNWYVHILYIMCPSRSSSNRLARPGLCAIADTRDVSVSRWISLAIRQIDRIRFEESREDYHAPIAPWHFPFRTTVGSKLRLGKRRHVREHRLSITRSDKVGSRNINDRRFFLSRLFHTRKSKSLSFIS